MRQPTTKSYGDLQREHIASHIAQRRSAARDAADALASGREDPTTATVRDGRDNSR
jgi:hypothetical protein